MLDPLKAATSPQQDHNRAARRSYFLLTSDPVESPTDPLALKAIHDLIKTPTDPLDALIDALYTHIDPIEAPNDLTEAPTDPADAPTDLLEALNDLLGSNRGCFCPTGYSY